MKNLSRNFLIFFIIFLVIAGLFSIYSSPIAEPEKVDILTLIERINQEKVASIKIDGDRLHVELIDGTKEIVLKETNQSLSSLFKDYNVDIEKVKKIKIEVKEISGLNFWLVNLLPFLIPFLLIAAFIYFMMRQAQGANTRALMFGQSRAREVHPRDPKNKITFKDVAGVKEAKEELKEIIEFLKNPKKFISLGAKIPKGVFLVGLPGTGKTLLARAVAGEAGVPFFSISGSEFVEMFVGVGASINYDTPVLIRTKNSTKLLPIGKFVDQYYQEGQGGFPVKVEGVWTLGANWSRGTKFFKSSAWKKVQSIYRHQVDKIYEIHFLGGKIEVTGDHSIFVRDKNHIISKKASELKEGDILITLPYKVRSEFIKGVGTTHKIKTHNGWQFYSHRFLSVWDDESEKEANYQHALEQKNVLSPQEIAANIGVFPATVRNWQQGKYQPRYLILQEFRTPIPKTVAVTPHLFKLFGFYVAEGRGTNNLEFTFGEQETAIIAECQRLMKQVFNLEPIFERTIDHSIRLKYYSAPLGRFFSRHCGNGSHHKHIPELLWDLPKEYFKKFLAGWALGDGYITKEGKLSITSVSKQLIIEMAWLSSLHGIKVGICQGQYQEGRIIKNRPLPAGTYWNLIIGKTVHPFKMGLSPTNQFKKPYIKKIIVKSYQGYVYDLCGCENEAFFGGEKPVLLHNSRVRSLFQRAKRNTPCIVFIDELDAVGRQRGAGIGGSNDEREQTLNQILVEMDGFDVNTNIIVMAATNRPDVLDYALLRPGRFDRRIVLDMPDINDRQAILKVHARKKPLAKNVDLKQIAERTPGFTGADLANLLNEAAILAARRNKKEIEISEILESIDKVLLGPERKSYILSKKEKEITAYHEAGHAIVAHFLPHTDPIRKISIIARGRAAGYTLKLPEKDKHLHTKAEFIDELSVLLAGYMVEKEVFKDISTGAANDLKEATKLTRRLVMEYGMSETLGPRTFGEREELIFLGREITEQRDYSEKVAELIDKEIGNFLKLASRQAQEIIKNKRTKLEEVVKLLLKKETIEQRDFEAICGPKKVSK